MCTRLLALLALHVGLAYSFSWDIVVGEWERLNFYYNGTITHTEDMPSASKITSVTYDPVQDRVLFADFHESNNSTIIYSFDISTRETQTIVTKITNDNGKIMSLAYDPVTQLLFWKERNHKIYSLSLKPASSNTAVDGNLLVTLDYICGDIAVDSCKGFIYWVTDNTIERAAFDGSKREVLLNGYVYWRRSLAIDQQTEKMYWIDETNINQHSIEMADLNGKNRRTFYLIGKETEATDLTISKDFIYWRSYDQEVILQLAKRQQSGVGPIVYSNLRTRLWNRRLTAANYTIKEQTFGIQNCEALKNTSSDANSTNVELIKLKGTKVSAECYGSRCQNYCFQGNCSESADGQPKCSCETGYSGERCEINACYKHCLNGGVCSLNEEDEPVCQCTADYKGETCEVAACPDNSVSAEGETKCRCNAEDSRGRKVNACHQYCLNDGVCSLNEDSEPVCQCTGDYEGDRCDVPAFLIKCFLYAYKNSPPVTLSKGVKSTCASTVV